MIINVFIFGGLIMGIKAVIFDLDGILVKTDRYHYLAWKRLLAEYGKDFTEEENELVKGVARIKSLEILLDMKKIEMSEVEKINVLRKKNNWYLEYAMKIDEDDVLPGVREFLELLKSNGLKTAIASTSDNAYIILELTGLMKYFDVLIDGYRVKEAKPNPEVFQKGAQALGIHPSKCVVFEDSLSGVKSGKAAGCKVVGLCTTHTSEELSEADFSIDTFENLEPKDVLKRLFG